MNFRLVAIKVINGFVSYTDVKVEGSEEFVEFPTIEAVETQIGYLNRCSGLPRYTYRTTHDAT